MTASARGVRRTGRDLDGRNARSVTELFEEQARTDELVWQQHRAQIEALFAESAVEHEFDRIAGDEVADIVDVAERHHADVVVLGAHEPGHQAAPSATRATARSIVRRISRGGT